MTIPTPTEVFTEEISGAIPSDTIPGQESILTVALSDGTAGIPGLTHGLVRTVQAFPSTLASELPLGTTVLSTILMDLLRLSTSHHPGDTATTTILLIT